MVRRERKFYSREFRERVLDAYYNSNEPANMIAIRFQVKPETVKSWVYRKSVSSESQKNGKFGIARIVHLPFASAEKA